MRREEETEGFIQPDSYDTVMVSPQESMDQLSAHLDRGWENLARGDLAAAERSALRALDVDSLSAEAYQLRGAVVWTEGRVEEAIEAFEKSLELDPENPETMLYCAEVLARDADRVVDARNMAEDALEIAESRDLGGLQAQAVVLLAELALDAGNKARAETLLRRHQGVLHENPALLERLGGLYVRLEEPGRAEEFLLKAIETNHGGDSHYFLGHIYLDTGRADLVTDQFLAVRYHDVTGGPPAWTYGEDAFDLLCRDKVLAVSRSLDFPLDERRILVVDYPGVEAIMQGVDPRTPVYLGREPDPSFAWFLVVYQLNVERACSTPDDVPDLLENVVTSQFQEVVEK